MRGAMSASLAECLRAHELLLSIYRRHGAGCCWHVVLDDNNADDDSVRFCIDCAANEASDYAGRPPHPDCTEATRTRTQRT